MGKGRHANVIQLYEVMIDEQKDKMYLAMEYAEKGQLLEWSVQTQNVEEFIILKLLVLLCWFYNVGIPTRK